MSVKEIPSPLPVSSPSAGEQVLLRRLADALQETETETPRPAIARLSHRGPTPLSFAQQRLWFLDHLHGESPLYNMTAAVRLEGTLQSAALRLALARVIDRHQILRTRFFKKQGEPRQEVFDAPPFTMPEIDLRGLPPDQRAAELQKQLAAEARVPFRLSGELLIRTRLYRLTPTEHVLFVNMHHIASDAASFAVFFEELSRLYNGFVAGEPVELPELPIQYADYAVWQCEELEPCLPTHLEYWQEHLSGAPDFLELPFPRARPAAPSLQGGRSARQLDSELAERLMNLARRERVTPFVLLLTAFNVLLHRFARQDDIVVGVPVSGRSQLETEPLIGFFINTLALRSRLVGDPSLRELLQCTHATTNKAHAHQALPFERLVEELRPQRTNSHEPLVQNMFVYQPASAGNATFDGLEATFEEIGTGTAKFDLMLTVADTAPSWRAELEYKSDLMDEETAVRWLGHFEVLLGGIAADPDCPVRQLPLLTAAERHRLLVEWNNTRTEYPRNRCVHELFEQHVQRNPSAIAINFGESRLTYSELNGRANQLARHLQAVGVKPGAMVAVCANRSLELVIGLLAILKAGGVYAALEPAAPPERLARLLGDLSTRMVLTQTNLEHRLPIHSGEGALARVICLDTECAAIKRQKTDNLPCEVSAESPAYVCFTSGSTGRPKGVCVPHRGIVRLVRNTNYANFSADEVFMQLAPVAFDASTFEIWGALLNGARLAVLPPEIPSLSELAELIRTNGVTTAWFTSGLFHQLVEARPECLRSLRQVLAGGDVLSPTHVSKAKACLPAGRLINGYGPTENTTFTAGYEVPAGFDGQRPVPVGRPIANSECYLLDGHGQPVPVGIPGELYAGGDGLALGYLNQPELTAEKFVPNPLRAGTRLYKTGDLARWLPDGNIEFLGRLDNQVKIRGYRVELGEIESALLQHGSVRDCAVIAREDCTGAKRLTAYVAPKVPSTSASPASGWREFLQRKLPEYMVPADFVVLRELPLSANGKLDRSALPAAERTTQETTPADAPKDELERGLSQLWAECLGRESIGVRDNFFVAGGHSLLAVRLVARIEERFHQSISVSAVFQHPTIEEQAALLRGGSGPSTDGHPLIVPLQPHGSKPPLVFVHGVGGGMFWGYANLARHLGPDQPVFAIKSRGLDGGEEFSTIQEAAAHYTEQLRRFQPHGPYYLGGYCFGGVVAYEMARRLHFEGEKVALLALINANAPNSSYTRFRWTPATFCNFTKNLCVRGFHSLRATPEKRRAFLRWKTRTLASRLWQWLSPSSTRRPACSLESILDLSGCSETERGLWQTHIHALLKYHPGNYPGHVTLFRSAVHPLYCSFDPTYGWDQLADGGVTVNLIPGAHETIMEMPHVRQLAAKLADCLA